MIVPPAAVKSPYYKNRTLQELWRLAAEALSQAEELVMMGFSLPQTDPSCQFNAHYNASQKK